jgi:hypothetical protein
VDKELVEKMTIYTYGGPSNEGNENLTPFDFTKVTNKRFNNYHKGIPDVWNFKPFYFGKEDFE